MPWSCSQSRLVNDSKISISLVWMKVLIAFHTEKQWRVVLPTWEGNWKSDITAKPKLRLYINSNQTMLRQKDTYRKQSWPGTLFYLWRQRWVFLLWTHTRFPLSCLTTVVTSLSYLNMQLVSPLLWKPVGNIWWWMLKMPCKTALKNCIHGSRGVSLLCRRHSLTYGVYAICIMNLVTTEITRQLIGVMTVELSCWKFLHTCT